MTALAVPSFAAASANWLPSQQLAPENASGVSVAADSQGTVLATWSRSDGFNNRADTEIRPPGGVFGPETPLSPPGANGESSSVAFDGQGNAIAVWSRNGIVQFAARPAGGSFGPAQDVSGGGESAVGPRVIFDSQGEAIVVWVGTTGVVPTQTEKLWASARPVGGSFGAPQQLDSLSTTADLQEISFFPVRLAADAHGDVFALWSPSFEELSEPNHNTSSVKAAVRPAGGGFSASTTLASGFGTEGVTSPALAADPAGDALVVWGHAGSATKPIEGKFRPAGGSFEGSAEKVSASNQDGLPQIAFDANGDAVAVWQGPANGKVGILEAERPAGGSFQSSQLVSVSGVTSSSPAVSITSRGDLIVAWERLDATRRIEVATRPSGAGFGSPLPLSPAGGATIGLALAADGQGDAIATWLRFEGSGYHSEIATYDGALPQLNGLSVPAHGTVGAPLSFAVAPFDVWSALTSTWSFGDGAAALGSGVAHTYSAVGTYSVTVTATDVLGNSTSAAGTVSVGPVPVQSVIPTITGVTQTHASWREGNKLAVVSRKRRLPLGTTFAYNLNEPARVGFAFTQRLTGHKVKRKCVAQKRNNRHARACKRTVIQGVMVFAGHAGTNKVSFQGRISAHKKLRPGRYTLVITATSASGQRSQPKSLTFTIVK